ncbi:MAG: DMT family transporter [Clostridia bacterium]|nr:DMT family transporter [Clostridia bacterium]
MWFIFALFTIFCWGGSDFFSKLGTDPRDKYSHLRMVVMVGAVMGLHAIGTMIYEYAVNGNVYAIESFVTYLPVAALYILAMVLGYAGLRYIELSVSSPICNSSGAVSALLCFLVLKQEMAPVQLVAVGLIILGIVMLSVAEKKNEDRERLYRGEVVEKKYQIGFIAILLPILYCIIDGLGTFADIFVLEKMEGVYGEAAEFQANTSYELMFLLCAIVSLIFLVFVKKEKFSLLKEKEKGFGALCETAGQFFYIYALASEDNAIVAAPMISSYCVFSVLLSRVFLKEKLSWKQYLCILSVVIGIIILGVFDI